MKCSHRWILFSILSCLIACAGTTVQAAEDARPGDMTVYVLTDRNFEPSLTPKEVQQRNQVLDWMGPDLVRVLNRRGGYKANLIKTKEEFKAGEKEYLLTVRIVRYRAGSKGARMIVGFGAGAVSLDIHYELFGQGPEPILAKDDGVGSSREWINCCRKLNENVLTEVQAKLKSL